MVKSLIGGNLIHLVVLETGSPGRRGLRQSVCRHLFVSVRVIHAPGGLLSVTRLHDPIPSDPGHYGPGQPLRESRTSPQLCFSLSQGHSVGLSFTYSTVITRERLISL